MSTLLRTSFLLLGFAMMAATRPIPPRENDSDGPVSMKFNMYNHVKHYVLNNTKIIVYANTPIYLQCETYSKNPVVTFKFNGHTLSVNSRIAFLFIMRANLVHNGIYDCYENGVWRGAAHVDVVYHWMMIKRGAYHYAYMAALCLCVCGLIQFMLHNF